MAPLDSRLAYEVLCVWDQREKPGARNIDRVPTVFRTSDDLARLGIRKKDRCVAVDLDLLPVLNAEDIGTTVMKRNAKIVRTIGGDVAGATPYAIDAAVESTDTDRADRHEFEAYRERPVVRTLEIDRTVKRIPLILPKREFFLIVQMRRKLLRRKSNFLNPAANGLSVRFFIIIHRA